VSEGGATGRLGPIGAIPLGAMAAIFAVLLFLRHPAGVIRADFWGEDGWVWYPDAYRYGAASLLFPHTGYLQTISRIAALYAQLLPLRWAPTLFAVLALLIQLLPPLLLVSHRFDRAWPHRPSRLAFAIALIALPNSFEEFGNVTNSQWYLGILAFLVIASTPPRGVGGRVFDRVVLIMSGLSGPFCLMLAPVAGWLWFRQRSADALGRLVCVAGAAAVQAFTLLLTMRATRPRGDLGASWWRLAHIFVMKVEFALILGSHVMSRIAHAPSWNGPLVVGLLAVVGLAVLLVALWRGGSLFRLFALYGALVTAASLASPVVTPGQPAWVVLALPEAGQRYFLFPMLVFAAAFMSLAADPWPWLSRLGILLCIGMGCGVLSDWPYPSMRQTNFVAMAEAFEAAPSGTRMAFPIYPTSTEPMILTKR
jgi:hypothetical protein